MTPRKPSIPGSDIKATPGAPLPRMKCPALSVLDCVTPPQYPAHVGTQRAYLDTGAGFSLDKWLPSWWKEGWVEHRANIDQDALKYMADALPKHAEWILNVWENKYDERILDKDGKPINVEACVDDIRNNILIPLRKHRPDIVRGFYASIPSEHYDITTYHQAKAMVKRIDAGETIVNPQWWINRLKQVEPRYKAWINAVTRMTYGFDENGKLDTGGGLIDELDMLNPKCYLVGDLADGAFDALDIESDGFAIRDHVTQAKRVADGRPVFPMMHPYIEGTTNQPKRHRLEIAMKVARDAGADGCVMWHHTGGRMPNEWERDCMNMAVDEFEGKAAA